MTKKIILIALITCLPGFLPLFAGTGLHMRCQAKPHKGPSTAPCGYDAHVTFGGGMFFDQIMGYCPKCKTFVYLSWTRANIPEEMKKTVKAKPRPEPLGEVWNAQTGKMQTIHACPACKGPFLEIKKPGELTHCPACNEPGFAVDPSKPVMAID